MCLTVSGGHTQIVKIDSPSKMQVIGTTLDDAAGEAFDKSAKILGLPYPGGPLIDKYAKGGNIHAFTFGKPKIKDLDFSFSGLKTALINYIKKNDKYSPNDVAASYQEAIVDTLMIKLNRAMNNFKIDTGIICGGVAANKRLREKLGELDKTIIFPSLKYCTDNADMIAFLGEKKMNTKSVEAGINFSAYSRGIVF